jgi:hypothetical protein
MLKWSLKACDWLLRSVTKGLLYYFSVRRIRLIFAFFFYILNFVLNFQGKIDTINKGQEGRCKEGNTKTKIYRESGKKEAKD